MASPHAAGVAALALSANPGLRPAPSRRARAHGTALPCPDGVYDPGPTAPSTARRAPAASATASTAPVRSTRSTSSADVTA